MIVFCDGYHKQCSSIPFCVVGLDELRVFEETGTINNLVNIFPFCAYVDFLCREEPGGAIGRIKYRGVCWLLYFSALVPSYKRISAIKDCHLIYPRESYHQFYCIEKNIKKGYITILRKSGSEGHNRLLLVYGSLKNAKREIANYYSCRSNLYPNYSFCSLSVSRVVVSLSNPVALFGLYNGYNIGFWWCELFLTFLQGNFRPKHSSHIFFHYELDPDKNEIRYLL